MIQVYRPNNTDYAKNGDVALMPRVAQLHTILNGAWQYTLVQPIDEEGRWKYVTENAVIKAPSFNGNQLFRIKKIKKGEIEIQATAEPIFFDATDEVFITDIRPTDKTCQEALDLILAPGEGKFSAISNITTKNTAYFYYRNFMDCLNGNQDPTIIRRWGGEILFNNYEVVVNNRIGSLSDNEVRYGKNIPANGFTEEIDTREVVTRIYPVAFNGRTPSDIKYFDSPLINNYPTIHAKTITFDNIRLEADATGSEGEEVIICKDQTALNEALKDACDNEFKKGVDKPKVTIKANLVLLKDIVGYEEYKDLENIRLGDDIYCRHSLLDITTIARVTELVYDSLTEGVTSVTIGDFETNFFNNVTSAVNRVDNAIREDGTVIGSQVSGIINGAQAQFRLQNDAAEKQDVIAILFEDLDPTSPSYGAMALGTQGFQISQTMGADGQWVWQTFGTAQGFNAELINAGTLNALTIIGAVIDGGNINGSEIHHHGYYMDEILYPEPYRVDYSLDIVDGEISLRGWHDLDGEDYTLLYYIRTRDGNVLFTGAQDDTSSIEGGRIYAGDAIYINMTNQPSGFDPTQGFFGCLTRMVRHETIRLDLDALYHGYITQGSTYIYIYIPISKPIPADITPTITLNSAIIRGVNGYAGGKQNLDLNEYTITATVANAGWLPGNQWGIRIRLAKNSGTISNVTNNTPISAQISGLITMK